MLCRYLFIVFILFSFLEAKVYNVNLIVDEKSSNYTQGIKKELENLFSSNEKIIYNIKTCKNCINQLNKIDSLVLVNSSKRYKNRENTIISYNLISSVYDENKLIRTTALALYELLTEKKYSSIYIKNQKLKTKEVKEIEVKNKLDLKKIYSLAKNRNIQIKQNENEIKLSNLDIDEAKSSYLPSLNLYSNYIKIDKDRAKYSSGLYNEGTLNMGVKLTQLIYSDKVIKNIEIKRLIDSSSKDEVKALNDEIMYKATLLYLNIIKLKKHNQIIKIKQGFIKQNLMFAKQRVQIGVQNRSDIFRWESELANVNIELASAIKELNSLKIEFSNLLQVENSFDIKEYGMNSNIFKLSNKDAIKYLGKKSVQDEFSNNIVHRHARLKQIAYLEKAKNKELQMNKQSRYLPTLAFEGDAKRIIHRDGDGKDFPRPWDNEEYQAVLNLNFPLYEGGVKSTKIQKNQIELNNLKLEYNRVKNLIVENVKKNFESLKSSYEKIKFAKISQNSSKKNFELIQDRYKKGKENIISLLDAQNSFIVSKLNQNISIIEYLSDLSSIYFFSGNIDILINKNKKQEVEKKILNIVEGEKK